jgi:hypothetical protein
MIHFIIMSEEILHEPVIDLLRNYNEPEIIPQMIPPTKKPIIINNHMI